VTVTQTERIVHLVRDVLGADLVGAYLHGSAVLGGLRPRSDADVLVVVRRRTTAEERRALVDGLLEVSGARARRGPARPVELTIVVRSDVRPWRYPPRCEFLYGDWLRDEFERGATPSPEPNPDLALLITMALHGNTPLLGPPPGAVLDPVPHEDVRRASVAGVPHLLADLEWDTRNVVLTLART
jgi:streptomycin 3"-adenylyltransferase